MIGCFHIRLGGVAQMRFKVAELQEPLLLASNKDYQHSITQVVINICSFPVFTSFPPVPDHPVFFM